MNKSISLLSSALISLTLAACAPSLGVRLAVPGLPEQQDDRSSKVVAVVRPPMGSAGKARVAAFNDARASTAFAVVDGRQVASEGNLGAVVQEGLERYLRDAGVRVVLTGGALVEGEIVEWRANIKPSFPTSDVTAVARIKVTVRDPRTNALGYRGTFSGEASVSDPILTEREVQKLLTEAMRSALQALLKEESFMAQIAAGS